MKTVQNPLEKYKLKSGIIIWYSHSVIGLYFNFSKQNPVATFFDLFIMSFSTGFQQEFVNCWKWFSYYKDALFQHDRSAAGFLIFILQYCHSIFALSLTRFAFRNPNGITYGYATFDLLLQNLSITKQKSIGSFIVTLMNEPITKRCFVIPNLVWGISV